MQALNAPLPLLLPLPLPLPLAAPPPRAPLLPPQVAAPQP
jgi:hypothetical protein